MSAEGMRNTVIATVARKTAEAAASYFDAEDDKEFIDNLTRDIVRQVNDALAAGD